jgi:hypothetical protein
MFLLEETDLKNIVGWQFYDADDDFGFTVTHVDDEVVRFVRDDGSKGLFDLKQFILARRDGRITLKNKPQAKVEYARVEESRFDPRVWLDALRHKKTPQGLDVDNVVHVNDEKIPIRGLPTIQFAGERPEVVDKNEFGEFKLVLKPNSVVMVIENYIVTVFVNVQS